MSSKTSLLVVIATMVLAAVVLIFAAQHSFGAGTESTTLSGVSCDTFSNNFTIIASQNGYNNSIAHGAPSKHWPIVCARAGEMISITVVNTDNVEPHGFAIAHYDEAGVTVLPGKSTTISFFAGSPGDYKVFCNVICAVHIFMQSGVLVVGG